MNKYHQMKVQKNLKQELRIKSCYILDLGLIIFLCGGMFHLQSLLVLPIVNFIMLELLLFGLALFLCAKPSSNGGHRNSYTIFCLLKMDRKIYGIQTYN